MIILLLYIAFLAGLAEKNIMLITGHRTAQAFNRYIRCSNMDAAIKIANHDFFNLDLNISLELPPEQIKIDDQKAAGSIYSYRQKY